ncbi:MAG TPA: D-glycero-beta-D-manno-heptose-7-phosphate kinase [Pyrinomonadaceae bacterium]|nr:D-glycero-beta-D-manno-heptose-7-phosphate kinase [Pyrinomonadaceae bacterium]
MNILEQISGTRVLVVGDIMLDRYWWGDVTRISPEAPVPVVRLRGSTVAPGGAANVAANVAGLGATPILVGAVGKDPEADELRESLGSIGVEHSAIVALADRSTIVKTRIVAHGQHVVRVDREDSPKFDAADDPHVIKALKAQLSSVQGIILSDYGKGFLSDAVINYLIGHGSSYGIPVFVDPKGKDYKKYRGATMITPNRREAAEACRLSEDLPDLVQIAGRMLLEDIGVGNALITEGEHGMTLFAPGQDPFHIDAHAVETYDVTGAGDTVIATIGTAHAAGATLADAAELANRAAGIVVQQVGTTAIKSGELTA